MAELQKDNQETTAPIPTTGTTITPVDATVNPPSPTNAQTTVPTSQAPQVMPPAPQAITSEPSSIEPDNSPTNEDADSISWAASEFHSHEKSAWWYIKLALITIVAAGVLYVLTKSIVTPVVIVISGVVLGIYGTHKPGQLEYTVTRQGIRIGAKRYSYDEFRLFVVTPNSSLSEVTLIPTKRFMPPLSICYSPDIENKVLNILADHLPFEERRPDLIDSLMQRMHF